MWTPVHLDFESQGSITKRDDLYQTCKFSKAAMIKYYNLDSRDFLFHNSGI